MNQLISMQTTGTWVQSAVTVTLSLDFERDVILNSTCLLVLLVVHFCIKLLRIHA
jgi:hypothetical protein